MKSIPILTEKAIFDLGKSLRKLVEIKYRETELPFVTLKYAQTLDGKIATITGDSKWISGASSLRFAHQLRSWHDAVLVGVGTIKRDNPHLTVRLVKGRNPKKIIVDTKLKTPLHSNVLRGNAALSTIIATTSFSDPEKIIKCESKGAEVWLIKKDRSSQVELQNLLWELGQRGIRSLLVEGGSKVISSFLQRRLADHLVIFFAPKIIGSGMNSVSITTPQDLKNLLSFSSLRYFRLGDDIVLEAFIRK